MTGGGWTRHSRFAPGLVLLAVPFGVALGASCTTGSDPFPLVDEAGVPLGDAQPRGDALVSTDGSSLADSGPAPEHSRTECLASSVTLNPDRSVPCAIVEVAAAGSAECDCSASARGELAANLETAAYQQLASGDTCSSLTSCQADFCLCGIFPAGGDPIDPSTGEYTPDYAACLTEAIPPPTAHGWCYIDPPVTGTPTTQSDQVTLARASCPDELRLIRFVNDGLPRTNAVLFLCP